MEEYVEMKSPFTGGRVKEVYTTELMEYKGREYAVHVRYYVCEDTGEKFTTTEQDQEWYDELHTLAQREEDKCDIVAEECLMGV